MTGKINTGSGLNLSLVNDIIESIRTHALFPEERIEQVVLNIIAMPWVCQDSEEKKSWVCDKKISSQWVVTYPCAPPLGYASEDLRLLLLSRFQNLNERLKQQGSYVEMEVETKVINVPMDGSDCKLPPVHFIHTQRGRLNAEWDRALFG